MFEYHHRIHFDSVSSSWQLSKCNEVYRLLNAIVRRRQFPHFANVDWYCGSQISTKRGHDTVLGMVKVLDTSTQHFAHQSRVSGDVSPVAANWRVSQRFRGRRRRCSHTIITRANHGSIQRCLHCSDKHDPLKHYKKTRKRGKANV